jgi:hypothetical protein
MWRSRARLGLGLGAIIVALTWPAAPAARAAPADVGTWQVSPGLAHASAAATLAFTYTAPAQPPSLDLTLTVDLPADWTAAAPATVSCGDSDCAVTSQTSTQLVVRMYLRVASPLTLEYPATAPGYATTSAFTASEQWAGQPPVTDQLAPLQVTVECPNDGTGMMSVDPSAETAGSSQTLTFTYTAGSCGVGAGGLVAVTVPGGWTPPSTTAGTPGFATWAGGTVSVTGSTITVPVGNLAPGGQVSFAYEMPQAPGSPAGYTFAAAEQSGADGSLQALAASPLVTVMPVVPPPTTPAGGGGTTPAGGGGTTPAGGGGTTPAGGGGTTPAGKVKTAHPALNWLPVVLLVIGLVLAAGTTGRLAFRGLRRRVHGTAADVRTVPHTGPPTTVVIRDTGPRPALTVRIEPHDSAAVTTIEETRP